MKQNSKKAKAEATDLRPNLINYTVLLLPHSLGQKVTEPAQIQGRVMLTPASYVCSVVDVTNKFAWTGEVLWRKGTAWPLSEQRAPQPSPRQAFIAFLGALHQGRCSFIMHRFALGDYLLQITKKRMLQMQGKKWLNWLHSILGRFSTDFRKLLQRYALNICCLNSG